MQRLKIFLLIAAISSVVYANSLSNSFHFDDQHYIVTNPYITDLSNIPSFFKSTRYSSFEIVFTGHYRPLLVTSYALNYAVGGLRPAGYHVVNLLFHAGSAFLVFLILEAMLAVTGSGRPIVGDKPPRYESPSVGNDPPRYSQITALAAALIFAVHPFNSEVVNYITARSSVMCAFFYLLAFYCWVKFRSQKQEARGKKLEDRSKMVLSGFLPLASCFLPLVSCFYFFSLLSFALAILTKEIAITLPVVFFLYDLYFQKTAGQESAVPRRGHNKKMFSLHFKESPQQTAEILQCSAYRNKTVINLIAYLPYILLVIIPYLLYRIYSFGRVMGGEPRDFYTNLLTQPRVLLRYLQLLFLPAGLTIEHTIASASEIYDVFVILPVLALIVLAVAAYLLFRKAGEWRILSFFMAWFFITLLPTTLIPLNAILQENRGYLAGIGFPIFAGILIGRLPRRASVPLLLVVVSLCSIATIQRNQVWKDEYTLWRDAVDKAPYSARAHDNLGLAHITRGEYERAIDEFNKTIEIQPRYYLAYYNAGAVYQMQNNLDFARSSYEACLRINPQYFRAYYNLGILFKKAGELDQAISNYEKAISLDPRHPFVYNNLGVAFTEKGERDKAESAFKRATELDPGFIKAYFNLGNLYYRTGRHNLAAEAYRTVLKLQPDYKEAERMLNAAMGTGSGLEF